jgi:hypothetical protein
MMIKLTLIQDDNPVQEGVIDGDTLKRLQDTGALNGSIYRIACSMRPGSIRSFKFPPEVAVNRDYNKMKIKRMS